MLISLSTVKKPGEHTICTPRKQQRLNSTPVHPLVPTVQDFFHSEHFRDAIKMIRDVPEPGDHRESIASVASMILNNSSSTQLGSARPSSYQPPLQMILTSRQSRP